ncbi:MAG: hypothetical protein ABIL70_02460 [candidate division WOR-3 bacterium]
MRYIGYLLLLYLFVPINHTVDLITILLFFVLLNESPFYSIVFAFFAGLVIDLYHPVALGVNSLFYLLLGEGLILLKKYLPREFITINIVFIIFYCIKILLNLVVLGYRIPFPGGLLTLFFFPISFFLLNKIFYKVWKRA